MIVLWNTQVGGWLTPGGSYTSDLDHAKRFTSGEATDLTRRHYNAFMQQYGLIPVHVDELTHD